MDKEHTHLKSFNNAPSKVIDLSDRPTLWAIKDQARAAMHPKCNPEWQYAYEEIIHAVDRLDAMIARSTLQIASEDMK